jgi:ParB/RepB/Spo0J family partition protein
MFADLVASIRVAGVLLPVRVRQNRDGRYEIIDGHRRVAAAREAGLRDIPAVVVDAEDPDALAQALIANIQREDLSLADRGEALARVRGMLGLGSWAQVGERLGISRAHVQRLLNYGRLPVELRRDPRALDLTEKHVRALTRLRADPSRQRSLWARIHVERLTGEDALRVAAEMAPSGHHRQRQEVLRSATTLVRALAAIPGPSADVSADEELLAVLRDVRDRVDTLCRAGEE